MKKLFTAVVTACALTASLSVQAETIKRKICLFDIVCNVVPVSGAIKHW